MKFVSMTLLLGSFLSFGAVYNPAAFNKVTMTGQYEWNQQRGKPGDIRAEFTPIKDGEWDVSFFFKFRGENHTYSGTAFGNLTDGTLKGKVQNERKNRTWRFQGHVSGGNFKGTHVEINRSGKEEATGTIQLTASK